MSAVQPSDDELKLAQYLLNNPLETFAPTAAQQQFLALNSFIQIFSAANWTGKTAIGAIKLSALCFGTQNPFFAYEHLAQFAHKFRFRIVSTHTAAEQVIIPEIKKWFPKGRYTTTKGNRNFESRITCDTGTVGDLMTYDQNPDEFESVKLDLIWFDEPPPYAIFSASVARMKPGGIMLFTMTPLSSAGWIFDRMTNPWQGRSWGVVYADIESCCVEHGHNGYLPHADIERKIAEYDEEEKEARISGRPVHLAGVIFKSFNRKAHVVEPFDIPPEWTRYCIIDPHDRKPFAIIWAAVSPDEKWYVYDEWPNEPFHTLKTSDRTVADYATLIRAKESGAKVFDRIIDARFGKKVSSQTGKSIRDMLDEQGLYFHDSYLDNGGSVDQGHQAVREALKPGSDGVPTLRIFSTCHNVIYGFEHYCWDDFKDTEKAPKERPKSAHKDFMDVVRYFVMEEPRYVEPSASQENSYFHDGRTIGYGSDAT